MSSGAVYRNVISKVRVPMRHYCTIALAVLPVYNDAVADIYRLVPAEGEDVERNVQLKVNLLPRTQTHVMLFRVPSNPPTMLRSGGTRDQYKRPWWKGGEVVVCF